MKLQFKYKYEKEKNYKQPKIDIFKIRLGPIIRFGFNSDRGRQVALTLIYKS